MMTEEGRRQIQDRFVCEEKAKSLVGDPYTLSAVVDFVLILRGT